MSLTLDRLLEICHRPDSIITTSIGKIAIRGPSSGALIDLLKNHPTLEKITDRKNFLIEYIKSTCHIYNRLSNEGLISDESIIRDNEIDDLSDEDKLSILRSTIAPNKLDSDSTIDNAIDIVYSELQSHKKNFDKIGQDIRESYQNFANFPNNIKQSILNNKKESIRILNSFESLKREISGDQSVSNDSKTQGILSSLDNTLKETLRWSINTNDTQVEILGHVKKAIDSSDRQAKVNTVISIVILILTILSLAVTGISFYMGIISSNKQSLVYDGYITDLKSSLNSIDRTNTLLESQIKLKSENNKILERLVIILSEEKHLTKDDLRGLLKELRLNDPVPNAHTASSSE